MDRVSLRECHLLDFCSCQWPAAPDSGKAPGKRKSQGMSAPHLNCNCTDMDSHIELWRREIVQFGNLLQSGTLQSLKTHLCPDDHVCHLVCVSSQYQMTTQDDVD